MKSETLSYEISTVVKTAINEGRSHLNDEEAIYLLRMSEKLVQEYVDKLEKMSDDHKYKTHHAIERYKLKIALKEVCEWYKIPEDIEHDIMTYLKINDFVVY